MKKALRHRPIDYRALADFRFEIRRFLHSSERIVRAAGLEPQQHQALLAIKGLPAHRVATVGVLAERLLVQHHSAVELVNRLETKGLLRRARGADDRREVRVHPLAAAEKSCSKQLALTHRAELKIGAPQAAAAAMAAAIARIPRLVRATPALRAKCAEKQASPKQKPMQQSERRQNAARAERYSDEQVRCETQPAQIDRSREAVAPLQNQPAIVFALVSSACRQGLAYSSVHCLRALYSLIGLFTNLAFYHEWSFHFRSPRNSPLGWWMILIPVVGGVLIGLMAKYGSEKIRGHGIPEAMEAVLTSRSRIEAKVAFLKPLSAAIGIGTGGPFGAEGPIIQTGGAFGSLIGQFISTTAAERKVMLACGGGAGLAATFNAPITGVLLALELLLFEFRTRSFIPVVIACTMAVAVRRLLFGGGPMFEIGTVDYNFLPGLPYYVALGLLCGFAAVAFTRTLEKLEEFFDHLKIVPSFLHPALGALVWASSDFVSRACWAPATTRLKTS